MGGSGGGTDRRELDIPGRHGECGVPDAPGPWGSGDMVESDPDRVALRFVNEINRHDVPALFELMASDFRYVDGLGQEIRGREKMRDAWATYFGQFPDYHVVIRDHLALGSVVALFGTATGTCAELGELPPRSRWSLPIAWRAVVREGRVEEWQVYTDSEPIRTLLSKRGR